MISDKIDINSLVDRALESQDERSKRILKGRYGLGNPEKRTLAQLGKEYGLTRERVRQIQASSLSSIRDEIKSHKEAIKLLKLFKRYMKDVGHIRRSDLVADDISILLGESDGRMELANRLRFMADVLEWPTVSGSNEDWHAAWYSKEDAYDKAKELVRDLMNAKKHSFEDFIKSASDKHRLSEPQVVNHLIISKRFGIGPYGDMGADHWVHVNPKTVRDKIYLVLKRANNPLHFSEIAELVNELSDKKRAAATVHNELIKDDRFNLVGRGTYTINV